VSIAYCADHDEHVDWDHDTETHRFCHSTDGVRFTEPTSWAPEFYLKGDDEWCGNAQRFATEAEAYASANSRFMVWTVPSDYRAAPSDDPVNYAWDEEKGDVFANRD
jgi:hypothetical protein